MTDLFVGRIMSSPVETLGPNATISEAAQLMDKHGFGAVVITDETGQIEGIITETDIVRLVASEDHAEQPVSEYMTRDVLTTSATAKIREAADIFIKHDIRRLPVVHDEAGVIGIVTTTDLTAYLSHVQQPSPS